MPESLVDGLTGGLLDYLDKGNPVRVAEKSRVAYCTAIDVIGSNGNKLAFINQINNVSMQRNLKIIRMLNSIDAGTGIELVPGVVTITFTANSFTLWPADDGTPNTLMNRLMQEGTIFPGMISDTEYFDIGIHYRHPYLDQAAYVLWFLNCMISNYTINDINIEGDNVMVETANITALRTGYSKSLVEES